MADDSNDEDKSLIDKAKDFIQDAAKADLEAQRDYMDNMKTLGQSIGLGKASGKLSIDVSDPNDLGAAKEEE